MVVHAGAAAAQSPASSGDDPDLSRAPQSDWTQTFVNGDQRSLALLSEGHFNLVSGGFTVVSSYDDNALSSANGRVGNLATLFRPDVAFQESRPRMLMTFDYGPGFTVNQRLEPRYDAHHDLDLNLQFRVAEHLTLRLHDNFVYGSSSFDSSPVESPSSGGNALHQPNTVIIPLSTRLSNLGGADLIYQATEDTVIGGSGSFSTLHFEGNGNIDNTSLVDNHSSIGDAFYSRRASEHHSIGVTYSAQQLVSSGALLERTRTQSILLFDTVMITPTMTLSVFAGPDQTTDHLQTATQRRWFADGGITFGWQGERTSSRFNFIHHVNDGGGLAGAVSSYSGSAGLRRRFGRDWTASLGVTGGRNIPITGIYGGDFNLISGTAGIEREFNQKVSIGMTYSREYQSNPGTGSLYSFASGNHNQAWVNVSYRFQHSLGN